jgi:hypothetical protein
MNFFRPVYKIVYDENNSKKQDTRIHPVAPDEQGNIYIASDGGGLAVLRRAQQKNGR